MEGPLGRASQGHAVNRRTFISSLGIGLAAPLVAAPVSEPQVVREPYESVSLTSDEYTETNLLEGINRAMVRWRKVNGVAPWHHTRVLMLGRRQREDCLNMCWSSSPTREFAVRATKADWYRISDRFFHDEVRAGRGEMFGIKLCWLDADHHFELL